ncbi:inositol monophosphatase family protein [Streptomyces sp. NPDC001822]|uniref:inositol monophosphatase family protein n=1 Tax=Streptomyces sp. NPDC001822 TaxID=3364614 RepID=UPI0036A53C5B
MSTSAPDPGPAAGPLPGGAGRYAEERAVAVAAAEAAGHMLRERFRAPLAVRAKDASGDVVTALDLAAEEIVLARLRRHFPSDSILSEEAGMLGGPGHRTWLVDPLDGTNNVAVGLPAYVVGIALCVAGTPVLGVVHEPLTGRTWHAVSGHGAHADTGPLTGPDGRLPAPGPVIAWTQGHAVGRGNVRAAALRQHLELGCRRVLQLWAPLLGWSMLARGTIDGFVGYRAEGLDLPAGALLAAESGVLLRTLGGGVFRPGFEGPGEDRSFVAARADTLDYLLAQVAAVESRASGRRRVS